MTATRQRTGAIHGRAAELARIEEMLGAAGGGVSGTLVITGPAGVGKTMLVETATAGIPAAQLRRVVGIEAEARLPYAGLHRLLRPTSESLARLPPPQRQALEVVFGLSDGPTPDVFMVGLAALTALADEAVEQPFVCLVDDAQWLDPESVRTFAFVGRRLLAEGIVFIFVVRGELGSLPQLEQLPSMGLTELKDREARLMLKTSVVTLDPRVEGRILRAAGGNPLALVEIPRQLSAEQLGGRQPIPEPLPIGTRLEDLFGQQLRSLSPEAQGILLVAAADASGRPELIWRVSESLGLLSSVYVGSIIEELGPFVAFTPRVHFRHPLVRSSAYSTAPLERRREIHKALADAIDPTVDPDRRVFHLAAASENQDEDVAMELERAAERARLRGGYSVELGFLERAVELTPLPADRGRRLLAGAEAAILSGNAERARSLLEDAASDVRGDPWMEVTRARLNATVLLALRSPHACAALADVARTLAPVNDRASRDAWTTALNAALVFDPSDIPVGVSEIARGALDSSRAEAPDNDLNDALRDAMATLVLEGHGAAVEPMRAALRSDKVDRLPPAGAVQGMMAVRIAAQLWEPEAGLALLERLIRRDHAAGALEDVMIHLLCINTLEVFRGRPKEADTAYQRAQAVRDVIGMENPWSLQNIGTVAIRGDDDGVRSVAERVLRNTPQKAPALVQGVNYALALLHLGKGEHQQARDAARSVIDAQVMNFQVMSYSLFIEAAHELGDDEPARDIQTALEACTSVSGSAWAQGIAFMTRGFLARGEEADGLFRAAITALKEADAPLDLGRAQFARGRALLRSGHPQAAIVSLRAALTTFSELGASAFAERARGQLYAAGGRPLREAPDGEISLTSQESYVAAAAARGATNREIAAEMFLSEPTVGYHLKKVFRKLGISSRRELRERMSLIGTPS